MSYEPDHSGSTPPAPRRRRMAEGKMSLDQVRDEMLYRIEQSKQAGHAHMWCWIRAIDAHLASQPAEQPRGEEKTYACSHCHGSGFGPDGKTCPVSHSYFVPKYAAQPKAATDAQVVAYRWRRRTRDEWSYETKATAIDPDIVRELTDSGYEAQWLTVLHPAPSQAVGAVDAKAERAVGDGISGDLHNRIHQMAFEMGGTDGGGYVLSADQLDELIDMAAPRPAVATPAEVTAEDRRNLIDSVKSLRDRWMATTKHDGHDGDFDILLEVIERLKRDAALAAHRAPAEVPLQAYTVSWNYEELNPTSAPAADSAVGATVVILWKDYEDALAAHPHTGHSAVPEGHVTLPREELRRLRNVLAMAAHPYPSPHAAYVDTVLAAAPEVDRA